MPGLLKRLSDKSRATKWSTLFGRTLSADQIITGGVPKQTAFADGIIAGLSELIGLSDGQPQSQLSGFPGRRGGRSPLSFISRKSRRSLSEIPAGEIRLANAFRSR